jgi:hypothetical protein
MVDFSTQAQGTVAASAQTPSGSAEMITVFLGNNDVCAASLDAMTDPGLFEASYRAGLDVLASSEPPAMRRFTFPASRPFTGCGTQNEMCSGAGFLRGRSCLVKICWIMRG